MGCLHSTDTLFGQILPATSDARAITAILPVASGHLLIGTKKRGVLAYDGKQITVLHPSLDALYVTALAGSESDLWVGTLKQGVLHFHAGESDSFTEAQGLPDPQVQAFAVSGDTVYAGTPTGVAVFTAGRFSRVLAPGVFATALLATPTQLYLGSEDQGVLVIPLEGRRPNPNLRPGTQLAEVRQLFTSGGDVFAVARDGLYRMDPHAFGWQRVLEAGSAVLSDRNISALAADASGHLWVGYFDRGLDLLTPDNGRAKHIEDEHVFCVNRIFPDSKSGAIDVATANGLVRFDNSGSEQQVSDPLRWTHRRPRHRYRLIPQWPGARHTRWPYLPRRQRRAQHVRVSWTGEQPRLCPGSFRRRANGWNARRTFDAQQGRRDGELHDFQFEPEA